MANSPSSPLSAPESPSSSVPRGLSSAEAADRLARTGPNEPAPAGGDSLLRQIAALFANPLVIILLLAAAVSAFLGDWVNAVIIVTMVLLGTALNFIQTFRGRRAADRLRAQVAPTATALRDGEWREVPRRDIVPGDLVRLAAGDLVPADAGLQSARDLFLQESALTGESMPVEKHTGEPVLLGTSVVSGLGEALVRVTGAATQFGGIAARLVERPAATQFERELNQFAQLILRVVFFLVLFLLVISAWMQRGLLESLLFAVALAVGLTPEFLPMISSVTLSYAAQRMARHGAIVKRLPSIQNFGAIDVLCSDKTGTLTTGVMELAHTVDPTGAEDPRPLALAYWNSRLQTGIRSPLDAALLAHAPANGENWEKRDELPFDFDRRRLSVVIEHAGLLRLVTKGAPESVLPQCRDAADPAVYQDLSRRGYRVLAVAWRDLPGPAPLTVADERDLTLAGYLAFADPPLPDAASAVASLAADGVAVRILTGDNELVTRHVCAAVGLDASNLVLGSDLERTDDQALGHIVETATVFARVSPQQKHRIILALQRRGHVVGYLGDGINDAPSLHAADVGIAPSTAVDVARDAAAILLTAPGLSPLHQGIREGRQASANVMKYLLMETSSNFGNMFSMAAAALFLPFLPMLPTQILLNNFLYDLSQIAIPTDRVDAAALARPHRWNLGLIRNFMLWIGPVSSLYDLLTFWVLLRFFHADEALFHTGWFIESLTTQSLVLFVIRTFGSPLRSRPSRALTVTILGILAVGLALPYSPLAPLLGFVPLPAGFFAFLAAVSVTYLLLVEGLKRRLFAGAYGD